MTSPVLVVAAHPDDEVLGCGGTLLKHQSAGDDIHILFMTNGVDARDTASALDATIRNQCAERAATLMGACTHYCDFPDNRMDSLALLDVVKRVETMIDAIQPETIYTHHRGDLNVDHRVTLQAVLTACRPQPGFCVREISSFEVLSSTEWYPVEQSQFLPNKFVDISDFAESKRALLECYKEELRASPHTRSIANVMRLGQLRGNSVGVEYAEAFQVLRTLA